MPKGQLKFKPGTIILALFIAIAGYAIFTLVSGDMQSLNDKTLEDRQKTFDCSTLNIEFVDVREENNTLEVFFRPNRDLERVNVGFRGQDNSTRIIRDLRSSRLQNASATGNFSSVHIKASSCSQIFSWR